MEGIQYVGRLAHSEIATNAYGSFAMTIERFWDWIPAFAGMTRGGNGNRGIVGLSGIVHPSSPSLHSLR